MAKYKAYPEYKDSGVEWLGEVPMSWSIFKLKFGLSEPLVYGANESALDDNPENPRYIRITDMNPNGTLRDDTFKSLPKIIAKPYMLIDEDILLARSGATVGKSFYYKSIFGASCFAGYLIRARFSCDKIISRFAYWFFQSSIYWQYINGSQIQATIQNVSAEKYSDLYLSVPQEYTEQVRIVNFLDHETAKIDNLIEKQQQLIELLKEKRQAVISHAVTKGLNPNVPMKDSGVEWLGEVPEHWTISRYKFCTSRVIVGIAEAATHAYSDYGTPIIRSTNIKEEGLNTTDLLYLKNEFAKQNDFKYLLSNDIVTVRTGYPGISAVIPDMLNGSHCFTNLISTPLRSQHSRYLVEYLNSVMGKEYFALNGWGSAQKNISVPILQNFPIAYPDSDEQREISAFVIGIRGEFNNLLEKADESIKLMQERRTALISAAVTGKIDVRDWVAPDTQETEKIEEAAV